jgi:Centromere protein H (CENP-H)
MAPPYSKTLKLGSDKIHDKRASHNVNVEILLEDEPKDGGASGGSTSSTASRHTRSVDALLSCCDSIVRTCLSYRTITPIVADSRDILHTSSSASLRLERQVARWLDEKIFEAKRHLHISDNRASASSSNAASAVPHHQRDASDFINPFPSGPNSPRAVQDMQQELLHRTSQLQLEHRFLSRVLMSKQAQQDHRPSARLDNDGSDDPEAGLDNNGSDDPGVRELRHGAIKARDRQISQALKLDAVLSEIRTQQRDVKDESSQLQRENRKLWEAIQAAESERQRERSSSNSGALLKSKKEVVNHVLEQLIRDLVLGSSLDWFADDRLRDMVARKNLP